MYMFSVHRNPRGVDRRGRAGGRVHVDQDAPCLRALQENRVQHQLLEAPPPGWHAIFPVSALSVRGVQSC